MDSGTGRGTTASSVPAHASAAGVLGLLLGDIVVPHGSTTTPPTGAGSPPVSCLGADTEQLLRRGESITGGSTTTLVRLVRCCRLHLHPVNHQRLRRRNDVPTYISLIVTASS